ncbi:MAG: hypothetical protein WB992_19890 [Bryobacteraceae bacterium]
MIEYHYYRDPTPHIFFPEVLPPKTYAELVFPEIKRAPKGRVGRDLYEGEPGYAEFVASPGWHDLHATFTSPVFVRWILDLFAEDLDRLGCKVDASKAYYEPYVESRDMVQNVRGAISDRDVNALFTRFDIQAAEKDYGRYVHLDRIRRLTGGLLFCSDYREEGLIGGEFALYRDRYFANDRHCLWPKVAKTFAVRHNTGVIFLNANTAFHGPRRTFALAGFRRWVYYAISSHQPVWSAQDRSRPRELCFKAKKAVEQIREWLRPRIG